MIKFHYIHEGYDTAPHPNDAAVVMITQIRSTIVGTDADSRVAFVKGVFDLGVPNLEILSVQRGYVPMDLVSNTVISNWLEVHPQRSIYVAQITNSLAQ